VASYQVFYSGRVQGVGFRYSVKRIASGYEVVGWVRNLPDGRVELQVDGEKMEAEAFLADIAKSSLRYHIQGIDTHSAEPLVDRTGFVIEH
jgi:acylphosphatase